MRHDRCLHQRRDVLYPRYLWAHQFISRNLPKLVDRCTSTYAMLQISDTIGCPGNMKRTFIALIPLMAILSPDQMMPNHDCLRAVLFHAFHLPFSVNTTCTG